MPRKYYAPSATAPSAAAGVNAARDAGVMTKAAQADGTAAQIDPPLRVTIADGAGRFLFRDLAPTTYTLVAATAADASTMVRASFTTVAAGTADALVVLLGAFAGVDDDTTPDHNDDPTFAAAVLAARSAAEPRLATDELAVVLTWGGVSVSGGGGASTRTAAEDRRKRRLAYQHSQRSLLADGDDDNDEQVEENVAALMEAPSDLDVYLSFIADAETGERCLLYFGSPACGGARLTRSATLVRARDGEDNDDHDDAGKDVAANHSSGAVFVTSTSGGASYGVEVVRIAPLRATTYTLFVRNYGLERPTELADARIDVIATGGLVSRAHAPPPCAAATEATTTSTTTTTQNATATAIALQRLREQVRAFMPSPPCVHLHPVRARVHSY